MTGQEEDLKIVVLLAILVLNVYKPRGMTAYERRKQRKQRMLSQP